MGSVVVSIHPINFSQFETIPGSQTGQKKQKYLKVPTTFMSILISYIGPLKKDLRLIDDTTNLPQNLTPTLPPHWWKELTIWTLKPRDFACMRGVGCCEWAVVSDGIDSGDIDGEISNQIS